MLNESRFGWARDWTPRLSNGQHRTNPVNRLNGAATALSKEHSAKSRGNVLEKWSETALCYYLPVSYSPEIELLLYQSANEFVRILSVGFNRSSYSSVRISNYSGWSSREGVHPVFAIAWAAFVTHLRVLMKYGQRGENLENLNFKMSLHCKRGSFFE